MKRYKISVWLIWVLTIIPCLSYAASNKPVATFEFIKASYQISEPIEVSDRSYGVGNSKIVKREWMTTINGKKKTSTTLKGLLSHVKVGELEVFLRVKDNQGVWSDWTSRKIKITASQPLKITSFKSVQPTYKIGEKLQLEYTYQNPNDLEIKSQRWRYRNMTTNGSMISGKPKYFKKEGIYEVTLELQDEWGNWSNKATCQVTVSNGVIERNAHYLFEKGKQGDLIEGYMDTEYQLLEEVTNVQVIDIPGKLIMSNSPESLYSSGILYRETTSGVGRLMVHHQNRTSYAKKLMIVVSASTHEPVTLKISKKAIVGPSKHILQAGQSAVLGYFKNNSTQSYTLAPGETLCIYDSALTGSWKKDEIISGTLDFESNGKITWQVVAMDQKSTLSDLTKLSVLNRDVHNRGTFDVIERHYILDLKDITKPVKLVLGGSQEEWLQGTDALTGETMWNKGNYGLPIKITVKNSEKIGVILNARGGSYLGGIRWNQTKVFEVPNEQVLSSQKVAALVGLIAPNAQNEIVYMLPNGSSAPVLFGFIPESAW